MEVLGADLGADPEVVRVEVGDLEVEDPLHRPTRPTVPQTRSPAHPTRRAALREPPSRRLPPPPPRLPPSPPPSPRESATRPCTSAVSQVEVCPRDSTWGDSTPNPGDVARPDPSPPERPSSRAPSPNSAREARRCSSPWAHGRGRERPSEPPPRAVLFVARSHPPGFLCAVPFRCSRGPRVSAPQSSRAPPGASPRSLFRAPPHAKPCASPCSWLPPSSAAPCDAHRRGPTSARRAMIPGRKRQGERGKETLQGERGVARVGGGRFTRTASTL